MRFLACAIYFGGWTTIPTITTTNENIEERITMHKNSGYKHKCTMYKWCAWIRSMNVYLAHIKYNYSPVTIHKYMNKEMDLRTVVLPKTPDYEHGKKFYRKR